MRWLTNLEGGPRRVNHAATAVDDFIYSFGGYCTGEDYEDRRPIDVHFLNTVSLRWSVLPTIKVDNPQYNFAPFQRYGHTANAYNNLIYIWGGRNDSRACNKLFCFNTVNKEWKKVTTKGNAPGARDGHTACIIQHKMYILGGYEDDLNQFSQDVFALNLETLSWIFVETKGVPPRRRDFHSATAIGHRMYVFGGRSGRMSLFLPSEDEIYCNQLMCLDTSTDTWITPKTNGATPIGRRSHSAFVYENQLYIFGGYNGLLNTHYNDIYKYNPTIRQWAKVKCQGKIPAARRRQCCCVVSHRLYMFGGTSPSPVLPNHRMLTSMDGFDNNLVDHGDLNVLDFCPTLKTLCELVVIEHGLEHSELTQDVKWELDALTTNNRISGLNKAG